MNVWDLMSALGNVREQYIEEAVREEKECPECPGKPAWGRGWIKAAAACLALLILSSVSVTAADYFSSLKGDELAFEEVEYLGDGRVAVMVRNDSDKTLRFQEDVKLCTFYGNREFEQIPGKSVKMEGNVIAPHSASELLVDLSEAYDMETLENMQLGNDSCYLVLTNDHFVFGQDWHCYVDFQERSDEQAEPGEREKTEEKSDPGAQTELFAQDLRQIGTEDFRMEGWHSPLASLEFSGGFGLQDNGSLSEGIHLAGESGEEVYAVDSAEVEETGYERKAGNYVILQLEGDVRVKYGHLKEICVENGQTVAPGEKIGTLGATGEATGPNLALWVFVEGETVDPLKY